MRTLNADSLVAHISEKVSKYKERAEKAESEGKDSEATDYKLRALPLNNLLIRISRGDFDVLTVKEEPSFGVGKPNINKEDWDLTNQESGGTNNET